MTKVLSVVLQEESPGNGGYQVSYSTSTFLVDRTCKLFLNAHIKKKTVQKLTPFLMNKKSRPDFGRLARM